MLQSKTKSTIDRFRAISDDIAGPTVGRIGFAETLYWMKLEKWSSFEHREHEHLLATWARVVLELQRRSGPDRRAELSVLVSAPQEPTSTEREVH